MAYQSYPTLPPPQPKTRKQQIFDLMKQRAQEGAQAFTEGRAVTQNRLTRAAADPEYMMTSDLGYFINRKMAEYNRHVSLRKVAAPIPVAAPGTEAFDYEALARYAKNIAEQGQEMTPDRIREAEKTLLKNVHKLPGAEQAKAYAAMEKATGKIVPTFGDALGKGLREGVQRMGMIGAAGLGALGLYGAYKLTRDSSQRAGQKKMLTALIESDPILNQVHAADPTVLPRAYQSMSKVAPTLSLDENAARSFLREAAMSGGGVNYGTIKGLSEAESAVDRATSLKVPGFNR